MYAIISDIHGNMYAFQNVLEDLRQFEIGGVILLGDLIDYGMQSNEVVDYIRDCLDYGIVCNIWGNHERAIALEDFTGFSSERGADCARYTAGVLTDKTKDYIQNNMNKHGLQEFILFGKKCLAVHGSLENCYWKSITPDNVRGDYRDYDLVFSGHSHYSHMFTKFYDADDLDRRNKHATSFINPGSVGQPRNHNPNAQYALLDENGNVQLRSVPYDVDKAMGLYSGQVDFFYRDRLRFGV